MTEAPAPAIRVHGLEDALRAARVAVAAGRRDLVLTGPAGGGLAGGAGWWTALLAAVRSAQPDLAVTGLLDCLDAPGAVLAALRGGAEDVVFDGDAAAAERLAAIAAAGGARLHRALPPVFDPAGARDPEAALYARLRAGGDPGR